MPYLPAIERKVRKMAKIDRRSARSRRQLWQALLALLQDHDWADISIQMICDQADVVRSTFYAHFPAKQDLLDAGFAIGVAALAQRAGGAPTLAWLVAHAAESQGVMRRVIGSAAGHSIQAQFHAMTRDMLQQDLALRYGTVSATDLTFIAGGVSAALDAWVAQGCREKQAALFGRLQGQIAAVLGVHAPA